MCQREKVEILIEKGRKVQKKHIGKKGKEKNELYIYI